MKTQKLPVFLVICLLASLMVCACRPAPQKTEGKGEVRAIAPHDWENPEMIGENKEPPHCTLMPYPDIETALKGSRDASPFHKSLAGKWKFCWVSKPSDRPMDFYKVDFDAKRWADIAVPGCWQLQGYDVPI